MQLQRNEILTGLLVLATIAVITGILILLGAPGLFRPLVTYKIYMDNSAGIKLGAPVLLAGRKIGQVDKLYSPVSKEDAQRAEAAAQALRAWDPTPPPTPPPSQTPPQPRPRTGRDMKHASMSASTKTQASTETRWRASSPWVSSAK